MIYITVEDFLQKTATLPRLDRCQEKQLALQKDHQALVNGYLHFVAGAVKRAPANIRNLRTVYACIKTLEDCVERFDFQQDSEPFSHRLSWALRQCITRRIADPDT